MGKDEAEKIKDIMEECIKQCMEIVGDPKRVFTVLSTYGIIGLFEMDWSTFDILERLYSQIKQIGEGYGQD